MTQLLVIGVIAFILIAVLKAKLANDDSGDDWPFYARKPLSSPEQVLYFRLCSALPDHIVLAQVGLSRLLGVKKGSNYQSWLNRISRMSADFVVCAKDSSIVAVIELDDASHEKESRKSADAKKDKAIASAGVRMIRWQVKSLPNEMEIKEAFSTKNIAVPTLGARVEPR